jgi:hypothetical protein
MKSVIDILAGIVGLAAFVIAIWQLLAFLGSKDANGMSDMSAGINHLWVAILAAIVACACAVMVFIRNRKEVEEIHITS